MPEAELMSNLVAHDSTGAHEKILFRIRVSDSIPGRIKATERKATNSLRVAGPTKAEAPLGARIEVLHCDAKTGV